jgi:hypothetical protein
MATIGATYFNLIDLYKSMNPDGVIADVIEMLAQMNPILDDAMAVECNNGTNHIHTVRTGLPDVAWGRLYKGIPNSKGQKAQVTDTTGFVEGLSTIDERILKLAGDKSAAVRLSEAKGFLESLNQEMATRIFYANSGTDPEQFMGLAPRFNLKSAANGNQIIDAGGSGSDNTSIWFVTWGDEQCHLLYPKGTQAGVERRDMGLQRVLDSDNNPYYAMEEKFTWHMGLAVKDWRYVARIANIDVSDAAAGSVKLYDFMRKAMYKLQNRRVAGGRLAIYMNRDMLEVLDRLATNAGAADNFVRLQRTEIEGKEVLSYRGIPIRETDALVNTEARVV